MNKYCFDTCSNFYKSCNLRNVSLTITQFNVNLFKTFVLNKSYAKIRQKKQKTLHLKYFS